MDTLHNPRQLAAEAPGAFQAAATAAAKARAGERAARVLPIARALKCQGKSLRQIAAELTERRVATPRGGAWSVTSIRNLLPSGTLQFMVKQCAHWPKFDEPQCVQLGRRRFPDSHDLLDCRRDLLDVHCNGDVWYPKARMIVLAA